MVHQRSGKSLFENHESLLPHSSCPTNTSLVSLRTCCLPVSAVQHHRSIHPSSVVFIFVSADPTHASAAFPFFLLPTLHLPAFPFPPFPHPSLQEKSAKGLGFHAMAMPEVLSALLDDNLAMKEKIGSANYVWSFPSDAYKKAKTKHETHTTQVDELKNQVMAKETKKKELEVGREETEEYVQMLAEMKSQKKQVQALQAEEAANASNDPAVLKELAVLVNEIKHHINRVTDNTFELLSFCVKKGMDRQDVKGFLNITDSFDNVD